MSGSVWERAASGGREFKNTGDGLFVAFSSASAAVSCAVLTQQLFERRYRGAEVRALHGGWHGGWCFRWLAEELANRGHLVTAPGGSPVAGSNITSAFLP
jgi:hypothetical protein